MKRARSILKSRTPQVWCTAGLWLALLQTGGCSVHPKKDHATPAARPPTTRAALIRVCESSVQKPDGRIVRVPDTSLVIIDLGVRDQIAEGTTFEVYDLQSGIPDSRDGMREGDYPQGKASIEVIRMAPGYSECRIIRRQPGTAVVIGDIILKRLPDKRKQE